MHTTPSLNLSRVGYVILFVQNMDQAIAFYRDTLGIPVRFADTNWSELETQGFTLALHGVEALPPSQPKNAPMVVFAAEDIRATREQLLAAGVEVSPLMKVSAFEGMVGISTDFADPAGNRLSVYGLIPEAEWQPQAAA